MLKKSIVLDKHLINEYLINIKGRLNIHYFKNNCEKLKKLNHDLYIKFLNCKGRTNSEKIFMLLNDMEEIKKCPICRKKSYI